MFLLGGTFKGRRLKTPKGDKTRPTTSLLRKSVFDRLAPVIGDSTFLDLFAGSGAMGLEALSRGARHATFVEQDKAALHALQANIDSLGVRDHTTVLKLDVATALPKLQRPFDFIYCDPPYEMDVEPILALLAEHELLAPRGLLLLEEGDPPQSAHTALFRLKESRRFGDSHLHTFTTPG